MSKYSDKAFKKILDDMPNRVTEVSTMEARLFTQHLFKLLLFFAIWVQVGRVNRQNL